MLPLPLLLCLLAPLPRAIALGPPKHSTPNAAHAVLSPDRLVELSSSSAQQADEVAVYRPSKRDDREPLGMVIEDASFANSSTAPGRAGVEVGKAQAIKSAKVVNTSTKPKVLVVPKNPKLTNPKFLGVPMMATPALSIPVPHPSIAILPPPVSTVTRAPSSASRSVVQSSSATKTSTAALVLPTPPSSSCAAQYTDTSSGAVYGPGLGSFAMSPRPSTFVKRSGAGLTLDGKEYRMVGPNIYWLGLDENVVPNPSYPTKGRIREAMAITVAMGGNTIRSHTLGVSTGNSLSVWPSAYNTNNAAFDAIDYSIFAARNYGLRLVIPLTDNYAYYHGGKFDFIGWAGLSKNDPSQFYYSNDVITIFKAYIKVLLNHVNAYTGVAYKDDPTILAWESGNELGGYMLNGGAPPASWTKNIAAYVDSIAPNHLFIDGADGLTDLEGNLRNRGFDVSAVDMVTDHFYPALNWLLLKDQGLLYGQTPKNFFVGELDWTGQKGGDDLSSFYSILEGIGGSGSMIWSVFGHDAQCCNYVKHNDGYSLEYPNGNSQSLQGKILQVAQHWYRMRGLTPPNSLPAVACPQPALLP